MKKKYYTDEDRLNAIKNDKRKWARKNPNYPKEYYERNIEKIKEYHKEYSKTQMGRAQGQIQQYKRMDSRNGFGDVIDFDARWMVDNIYTQKCTHCGESDWHKLGCNRIDNSKPHTKDNVEPCCYKCNIFLGGVFSGSKKVKPMAQIDPRTNETVHVFNSFSEAKQNGFTHAYQVANGKRKQDRGFVFKYI